ncbi:DUF2383 domain-containing protein [Anaeromicropila populeti]|uniref:DUF2383 domain-containing protein n=1 Tax=Anaeromicropila populeti TaxID=37658 RepID=A0A1I6KHC5_9FIRM|nr:DUF2383 domain-containing protein [Anaeromicropila populeti]SFR90637.1 protein of unknown function [Anaeromicropila populeti]
MPNDDTIKLLKECNAGVKMAVASFDEVMDHVQNADFKKLLQENCEEHKKIGDQTHELLLRYDDEDKEPNPVAKAMSWMKINMKMLQNQSDQEVAEIMMDGCNMGIKSIYRYLNQYASAEQEVKKLVDSIVKVEESLMKDLRVYL